MTREQQIRAVEDTAGAVGGSVQREYSGQGMFGERCLGVACDSAADCIEEAAARGLRGAKTDQLGRGHVVYWPHVRAGE